MLIIMTILLHRLLFKEDLKKQKDLTLLMMTFAAKTKCMRYALHFSQVDDSKQWSEIY